MQAEPQQIIGGKYRLIALLGTGGMGAVWRAEHTALRQQVAVKLLDARGPGAHRAVQRFLREGQIAAAVRHRNVVYISDFGTENGTPYLVMELLDGAPLADRLFTGETFRVKHFMRLMMGCLDGLSAVHAAGIIHRDIKPENIFLVEEGDGEFPKVLDFGLSRSVNMDESGQITREGLILGTPEYISPEQARGSKTLDRRADLYSLGVLIYEALAGRIPFEAENPADLIAKVLREPYVPLIEHRPDVGPALNDFVSRAMARDREERFASAEDMRAALEDAMEQTPQLSRLSLPRFYGGISGSRHYTSAIGSVRPPAPGERSTSRSSIETVATDRDSNPEIPFVPALRIARQHPAWMWPAAGAVALGLVIGVWGLVSAGATDRDREAASASADQTDAVQAPAPAEVEKEPALQANAAAEELPVEQPAAPEPLQVELLGVPEGATVKVDGTPIDATSVAFSRGAGPHEIEVSMPGHRTWRRVHDSDVSAEYEVKLVRRPKRQHRKARKRGSLVRDLDF